MYIVKTCLINKYFFVECHGEVQQIVTLQSPKVTRSQRMQPPIQNNFIKPINSSMQTTFYYNNNNNNNGNFHKKSPPSQQSTLDEITNKVFNELLQEKVESHANHHTVTKQQCASDHGSLRSDDWGSENSSSGIFGRLKRRDANFPGGTRSNVKTKKHLMLPPPTAGGGSSEDGHMDGIKKPLIAKLKAGVKLQVTARSENHG